ncbi:MAG: hypothetical protein ABH828_03965 [archaeon]
MHNKGPILIAYLSQIILVIVLLQVTGWLKGLVIVVTLITEALILTIILNQRKWKTEEWYAFTIFSIILLFLVAQLIEGFSTVTATLSVEMVVALIIGFFITIFTGAPKQEFRGLEITDIEVEEVDRPEEPIVSVKGSTKYHKQTCGYVKKAKKKSLIVYNSIKQAEDMGLDPCYNCN